MSDLALASPTTIAGGKQFGAPDLMKLGVPIAARLIPGWEITWIWCKPEDIGGALAMVFPDPLRERAVIKVAPHPAGESVLESVAHEITHACLSPLTALIEYSDAAVGIEERIVERIGKCFAAWVSGAPALARAMARALSAPRTHAPGIRARISALATGRRTNSGRKRMDPKMVTEALEALIGGDAEKCAEILKGMIAAAAGGGAEPAPDLDADGMRKPDEGSGAGGEDMETEEERKAKAGGGAPPAQTQPAPDAAGYGRQAARKVSEHEGRARKAADAATGIAVRARLRELETVDGVKFPENLRLRLSKMTDLDAFERDVEMFTAGRASVQPGNERARSEQKPKSTPAVAGAGDEPAVDEATLKSEGHNPSFIRHYQEEHAANPEAAKHTLAAARRARTQGDPASPWKKPQQANGAAGRS